MNRAEKIAAGKLHQVYFDKTPNSILFEGGRNKCLQFIRIKYGINAFKTGRVRIGKLILEK